ncbi:MAG: hypothetical protein NC819_01740 [Candidatus Omnitrophica bacterium]|nr:hypothetical protein [Candidatus Omnitrophota bacterium]
MDKKFSQIYLIVHAIYGAAVLYALIVFSGLMSIKPVMEEQQDLLFMVFMAASLGTFPLSMVIGQKQMGSGRLEGLIQRGAKNSEEEISAAVSSIQAGAIVMAACGESIGVFGLVYAFLTGDSGRALFFFGLTAVHYVTTLMKLGAVRGQFGRL